MPLTEPKISEVFGPTVQGEGPLAGMPTYFVRIGGCDYRCSWCDSLYAVLPDEVRQLPTATPSEIVDALDRLEAGPCWVTISGGNPAMWELGALVDELHSWGALVAVETQASVFRPWLLTVDMLVCSPKPPSSGMVSEPHAEQTARFLRLTHELPREGRGAMKIVVFDEDDLAFARALFAQHPDWPRYLSVGTEMESEGDEERRVQIAESYAWLCERVARDELLEDVRVLPQLHVIAWGARRGV